MEQMIMALDVVEQAGRKGARGGGGGGGGGRGGKGGPPGSPGAGGGGEGGAVPAGLAEEARRRYLNYALSVITSRALPDVRDGLKPVQRRILYGMWADHRLTADAKYQKCAKVVGTVMGQYHPHGDTAIYDALARMAQDFSLRYPLVDGHGNFGSLDGDAPAAMRYTECRLARVSSELLSEIGKRVVDFRPTYDGSMQEPIVIPSRIPQLMINGVTGIAVGMATNIPPHNLGETVDACVDLIAHGGKLETKDLLKHVKGPDFPTGGHVLNNKKELRDIYENGHGSVRVRGEWKHEAGPKGAELVVITSIPYTVNKANLVMKIGDLVRERKLPHLVDVRDESTREVRIVLELKKDASADLVMAYLYKHTPLQTNFNVNMTCLVPVPENPEVGRPERLDLKRMLWHFLEFREQVVKRRLEFELEQVKRRLHILEGFAKVYDALDEMIRIIRKSDGKDDAAKKLIARFKLSDEQADAILEMKLYKLARLEILVIQEELADKRKEAKRLEDLLLFGNKSLKKRWDIVRDELLEVKKLYGDKRRTKVGGAVDEAEYDPEAFIADEDAVVVVTRDGWIKRMRDIKDPAQTRVREGDEVMVVLEGSLRSNLVLFSNFGAAYVTRFNDIPSSTGYGEPAGKLFKFDDRERIVAGYSLDARLEAPETLVAVSARGYGLRFGMAPHTEVSTRAGRRYARPAEGDEIIDVQATGGGARDVVMVVTEKTAVLLCKADEINELSGPGRGVTVMKVGDDDRVIAFMCTTDRKQSLSLETQKGRKIEVTPSKYEVSGRGGKGREMSRNDRVKSLDLGFTWVRLPEEKK